MKLLLLQMQSLWNSLNFKRGLWLVEILVYKCKQIFWTQCKKFRLKFPYRYRDIVKNWIDFTYDVKDHVTQSQILSNFEWI